MKRHATFFGFYLNWQYKLTQFLICGLVFFGVVGSLFAASNYTVEPTKSNFTGSAVTINWSAPSDRTQYSGWIGIYEVGDSDQQYYRWAYINNSSSENSGSVTLTNVEPGTYEARFFAGSGYERLATSDRFTVSREEDDEDPDPGGGNYRLTLSDDTISEGDSVTVTYTTPGSTSRDWIGLYAVDADNRSYKDWKYVGSGRTGSATFTISTPGRYEFRYLTNDGYTDVAVSELLTVSREDDEDPDPDPEDPDGPYSVVSTQSSFSGSTVTINWSAPSDRNTRGGWIGIYESGDSDQQYYRWAYINSAQNSGSVSLANVAPGTYEARFFAGTGYDRRAKSGEFTVGQEDDEDPDPGDPAAYNLALSASTILVGESIRVTFAAPAGEDRNQDWIGLYLVGANNRSYRAWKSVGGGTSGTLTFTINTAGRYEFRYLKNNGYTDVATSPAFTVGGSTGQCAIDNLTDITNYPPGNGPIIAFGDSLTAGVGASNNQDYVSQLEELADVSISNAGVSGDTTRKALDRLEEDVLSQNPSTVIVWLGGNDILVQYYDRVIRGLESPTLIALLNLTLTRLGSGLINAPLIPIDETFENLETIVRRIQAEGAVVILVGFSGEPFNSSLESRFAEVAEDTGALYVPNALNGVIGRSSRMSDLIHPNNTGYGIVAERVYERFICVLEEEE